MSLILKTDVNYTGVVEARHILEYLITPDEKTKYLKSMLSTVNADSSYINNANSDAITSKLIAHIKRIQRLGATVLSIAYTLKAVVFVTKHNLTDDSYTSVSPDFGAKLDSTGSVLAVYGLGNDSFTETATPTLKKKVLRGENSITSKDNVINFMYSDALQNLSLGLIMGTCTVQNSTATTQDRSLNAVLDEAGEPQLLAYHTASRTANAASLLITMPTTTATQGVQVEVDTGSKDINNKAGIVVKYEYGTNQNKVYRNGTSVLADTGSDIMFNLSGLSVRPRIQSIGEDSGVIEAWIINSKDNALATALSEHLNRQGN